MMTHETTNEVEVLATMRTIKEGTTTLEIVTTPTRDTFHLVTPVGSDVVIHTFGDGPEEYIHVRGGIMSPPRPFMYTKRRYHKCRMVDGPLQAE